MGDFNSRSCNKPDFIDADEYFSDFFEFDENLINYFIASSSLDSIKFSKCRVSQDTVINNAGNLLLDMCKSNNLFILNGRCGADIHVGAMTFQGQSVIDYSIAARKALRFIDTFEIVELDSLFSDGHCLLSTSFKFHGIPVNETKQNVPVGKQRPKLPMDKKAEFAQNINRDKVQNLKEHILHIKENVQSVSKENINQICSRFSEIFQDSADSCINVNNQPKYINAKKPWLENSATRQGKNITSQRNVIPDFLLQQLDQICKLLVKLIRKK